MTTWQSDMFWAVIFQTLKVLQDISRQFVENTKREEICVNRSVTHEHTQIKRVTLSEISQYNIYLCKHKHPRRNKNK